MQRGKFVILLMLLVAVTLASFAWWHRWRRSQQVLTAWGGEAAETIRTAEHVELFRVGREALPAAPSEPRVPMVVDGERLVLFARQDISDAPGLIHLRHHLLHERGFAWHEGRAPGQPSWEVALRFHDASSVATMLLDFSRRRVRLVERGREVSMAPIAPALETFLTDIMAPGDGGDRKTTRDSTP